MDQSLVFEGSPVLVVEFGPLSRRSNCIKDENPQAVYSLAQGRPNSAPDSYCQFLPNENRKSSTEQEGHRREWHLATANESTHTGQPYRILVCLRLIRGLATNQKQGTWEIIVPQSPFRVPAIAPKKHQSCERT